MREQTLSDFNTFKQYAMKGALHPTIIDFLDINRDFFYTVENTPDGRTFVTARGWEDLSEMLILYEKKGYTVDENLVSQYIHNKAIVSEFTAYYELYNKYKTEYLVVRFLTAPLPKNMYRRLPMHLLMRDFHLSPCFPTGLSMISSCA